MGENDESRFAACEFLGCLAKGSAGLWHHERIDDDGEIAHVDNGRIAVGGAITSPDGGENAFCQWFKMEYLLTMSFSFQECGRGVARRSASCLREIGPSADDVGVQYGGSTGCRIDENKGDIGFAAQFLGLFLMNGLMHDDLAATNLSDTRRYVHCVSGTRRAAIGNGKMRDNGKYAKGRKATLRAARVEIVPSAFLKKLKIAGVVDMPKAILVEATYLDDRCELHQAAPAAGSTGLPAIEDPSAADLGLLP
jgi:hypothetical protein